MAHQRDYYEVLGVARDADGRTIKSAYRKLALQYHPDRNQGDDEAERRFKEASEAYEVLSDDDKRALYDRAGFDGLKSGGYSPFNGDLGDIFSQFGDLFSEFFGGQAGFGGFGGAGPQGPRPMAGSDLHASVQVDLEDAAVGASRTIEIERMSPCGDCGGTGAEGGRMRTCPVCKGQGQVVQGRGAFMIATTCRACGGTGQVPERVCSSCRGEGFVADARKLDIRVPAGVYSGLRLRLTGEGNAGLHGGPPGDLYVLIDVRPHETFARDGGDLHCELAVSYPMACTGGRTQLSGLQGVEHDLEVPPGSRPGDILRLAGAGVPRLDGSGDGDILVHLTIQVPEKLSKAQQKVLEELNEALPLEAEVQAVGDKPRPSQQRRRRRTGSFFDRLRDALDGE
ncbi:MAG: molecular chaperone DnaJ [Myxococcota bacterium]